MILRRRGPARTGSAAGQYRPVRYLRDRRVVALAVAALVGVGVAAGMRLASSGEDDLGRLERAQEAGERARDASDRIADNLDRLARNLRAGRGLASKSEEIGDLTARQRRSLLDLTRLLEGQLAALRRTAGEVEGTSDVSARIARLSGSQAAEVRRSVAALRRLRSYAAAAASDSGALSRQARYGARLAEDSRESFSR